MRVLGMACLVAAVAIITCGARPAGAAASAAPVGAPFSLGQNLGLSRAVIGLDGNAHVFSVIADPGGGKNQVGIQHTVVGISGVMEHEVIASMPSPEPAVNQVKLQNVSAWFQKLSSDYSWPDQANMAATVLPDGSFLVVFGNSHFRGRLRDWQQLQGPPCVKLVVVRNTVACGFLADGDRHWRVGILETMVLPLPIPLHVGTSKLSIEFLRDGRWVAPLVIDPDSEMSAKSLYLDVVADDEAQLHALYVPVGRAAFGDSLFKRQRYVLIHPPSEEGSGHEAGTGSPSVTSAEVESQDAKSFDPLVATLVSGMHSSDTLLRTAGLPAEVSGKRFFSVTAAEGRGGIAHLLLSVEDGPGVIRNKASLVYATFDGQHWSTPLELSKRATMWPTLSSIALVPDRTFLMWAEVKDGWKGMWVGAAP
jgi:hypothetical protein